MQRRDDERVRPGERITGTDLAWWLERAGQLEWIFARTYAKSAPHSYVVEGRTAGMSRADYVRAARVIHTFGQPAKFYGMTSIYLTHPDGSVKWWTMDADVMATTLINQATTDRLYGVQNAPVTMSGVETAYDAVASSWDEVHPSSASLGERLQDAFGALAGGYPPAVLDVGCGTGRVLDLGLTTEDRYAGVDPSTPMLNQLVRKHPHVGAVYPTSIESALDRGLFTRGQFEIVCVLTPQGEPAWSPQTLSTLAAVASRGLITAVSDEVTVTRSADR